MQRARAGSRCRTTPSFTACTACRPDAGRLPDVTLGGAADLVTVGRPRLAAVPRVTQWAETVGGAVPRAAASRCAAPITWCARSAAADGEDRLLRRRRLRVTATATRDTLRLMAVAPPHQNAWRRSSSRPDSRAGESLRPRARRKATVAVTAKGHRHCGRRRHRPTGTLHVRRSRGQRQREPRR